jgi:hypothetical protein
MPEKTSNWTIVAEVGMIDNGNLSVDQERAQSQYTDMMSDIESRAGVQLSDNQLVDLLTKVNENMSPQEATIIVQQYRNDPRMQQQAESQRLEPVVPEIQNPVSQESVLNIDSTVEEAASPPNPGATFSKYKGKYKKDKSKKHLKGTGPKAEKANEIYHAIMRDRDGKGEPTKEEQASAAAIAWSQAKKHMKKKAYFRGEEAKVLDSYRGMWGEELVRLSVQGQTVDVPRDSVDFVDTEVIDPVAQLNEFVSHIPAEPETRSEILANIDNLKTAKDIAYKLVVEGSADIGYREEVRLDSIHDTCVQRIAELERRLAYDRTDEDNEYLESLPQYEIGHEVFASSFSRENSDWMDEVIEKMAAEAEEIDLDKLANEDPLVLVASLTDEVVANATAVRNLALERVSSIAGPLDPESKEWVVNTYLEKTEKARRSALAALKQEIHEEVQEQKKTANSVPDEGLFL